ncbi:MAG: AEC family transporter [Candidatus Puniceispirillaceae bacterium]
MLSAIAATLAIVALGYVLKWRNFLPEAAWQTLSPICYWVLFPGLLFNLMSQTDLGAVSLAPFLTTIAGGSFVIVVFALVAGRAISLSGPAHSSLVQGALRHNGFLVLSILQGTFGVAALQLGAIAIAFLVPISNIVSVIAILMLTQSAGKTHMKRAILAEIARNPLLGSMLVGVLVNLLEIPVPEFISQAAAFLGASALPLLLLSIGASLRFNAIGGNVAPLGLALLAKFLVFPLAMVMIGLAMGLDPLALAVLAAVGAAPTASSSYTLAMELGGDSQLMAEIVSLQTLGAAVSLPLWIWLAGVLAAM